MDAGCGDGHIALKALKDYIIEGCAYAVDNHKESIEELEAYKNENGIENLITIEADFTKGIPDVEDESVDVILMLNVFHGFKASGDMDFVIDELKRMIKSDGRIAIMDFKAIDMAKGPSTDIKSTPDDYSVLVETSVPPTQWFHLQEKEKPHPQKAALVPDCSSLHSQ